MKLLIFFCLLFISSISNAQFTYNLAVKNKKGAPDAGRDVVFVETNTYERMAFKTNSSGRLTITFDHGEKWLGSIGEMRNCIELETKHRGSGSRETTYDPEGYKRENKLLPDRRSIQWKTIDQQRIYPGEQPTKNTSIISIVLQDQNRRTYPKKNVQLVCFETETIYESVTNTNGAAMFKVPNNQNYEIDVDGVESLRYLDLDSHPRNMTLSILYQPRTFKEQTENSRFIVQDIPQNVKPSSSHARVKLKIIKDYDAAINEDVYVRMVKSNKVYKGKTNDQGEVTFMLPIRSKYLVDFRYQRDADIIDLSRVKGIAFQENTIRYIPDPRLENIENFIPSVEELVEYDINNFVEAQYPEPVEGDMDFYLKWGNKFNKSSKEALLEIGLKVKSKQTRKSSIPLNICFVIDKSGSMTGEDRIEQLKRSLISFVKQLNPTDIVSIVVFDDDAQIAVPAEKIGDKKKIIDIIHAIQSDGGTNIYSGLVKGFETIKKKANPTMVNRLVLLTDGYGSTPVETIITEAKQHIKSGIELSAVGVGSGYNQALLTQLASAGGGILHLAGTSSNIQEAFQRELESILYPMAKEAVLTVSYNDQILYRQLYGYSNEQVSPGKMQVGINHLFPGLDKMALIKFDIINSTKAIERQPVIVKLEYLDAVTGKKTKHEKKIYPEWTDATGELDMAIDKEHKKALAVAIANQSLKVMSNSFEKGNRTEANQAVKSALAQIQNLFPQAKPEGLITIVDRLQEYVNTFELLKMQSSYGN